METAHGVGGALAELGLRRADEALEEVQEERVGLCGASTVAWLTSVLNTIGHTPSSAAASRICVAQSIALSMSSMKGAHLGSAPRGNCANRLWPKGFGGDAGAV